MPLHPWYRLKFQYAFATKNGSEFQGFIEQIFKRRFGSDFIPIKPYGASGDKKCDGILRSTKQLFQVYAPEQMKSSDTVAKVKEDFAGAVKQWGEHFTHWIFLHNQRALPPDVALCLIQLDGKDEKKVMQWAEAEVENLVQALPAADLEAVFGVLPNFHNLSAVSAADIRTVIEVVAQQPAVVEDVAVVQGGKLEANMLSEDVKALLRAGAQKSRLVGELFHKWHDPQLGDRIATAFRKKYLELKQLGVVGDAAFIELWYFAGGGRGGTAAHERASLALLTFLFEQCDIFEGAASQSAAQ